MPLYFALIIVMVEPGIDGIGNLWLTPYKQAAIAAFYRDVSGTEHNTYGRYL